MANIKTMDKIAERWKRVSSISQAEYEEGVRNPKKDWATETKKAEGNYSKGVQAAISRGAYGKGVERSGTAKWQKNSIEKGVGRWVTGIQMAGENYAEGYAPYREVIARTMLPARGPKGDPANIRRDSVLAEALHKEKLSRTGAK